MKPVRIGIAFALLLVLYGAYSYYEMVIVKEREAAQKAASLLLSIEPEKIIKVAVNGKQSSFVLQKRDGKWSITDPLEAEANKSEVNDIIDTAKDLTSERKITGGDNITKLSEYGLDKPATALFYGEGDGEPQKLIVGNKNPAGSEHYVMIGSDPAVYLVRNWRVDSIFPTLFEVQEKRLFRAGAGAVTRFEFRAGNLKVSAEKDKNNSWRLTSPVKAGADDGAVNRLVEKFVSALASGFIKEKADDLGEYGLDNPAMEFAAEFGAGAKERMLIGAATDDGNRYAMMAGKEIVVRISGDTFVDLPDSVNALRDFAIAKMEPEDVKELSVTFKGETVKLVSAAIDGGDKKKWLIIEPVKTDADPVAVDELLHDLGNSRAISFVDEGGRFDPARFGLDNPYLTLVIVTGKTSTTLQFGVVKKEGVRVYLRIDDRSEVMEIDDKVYTNLIKTLFDLRDKRFFAVASEDIGKVVVKRLGQVFEVVKSGNDYRLVSPENARLTPNDWNRLVWTITGLKYDRSYKPSKELDNKTGHDKPPLEISLYDTSGSLLESVAVGSRDEDKGGFYARTAVSKGLYNVNEKFVTKDIIGILESLLGQEEKKEMVNPHQM